MDDTFNPSDLFGKLSPRVAGALAAQLGQSEALPGQRPSLQSDGKAALERAWVSLSPPARDSYVPALARIHVLCARPARPYLLHEACASWGDTYPAVLRLLDAISTPDLAVRLYLESPSALERAHFQFATRLIENVSAYQGQYIADVIPSLDRRSRMQRVMRATCKTTDAAPEVADFVNDDRFLMALHRGARIDPARCFDAAHRLDANLCRAEIEVLVLFRFDSSQLVVKAARPEQRESLRDAFIRIFVGDPCYFDTRRDARPRYRLTLGACDVQGVYRSALTPATREGSTSLSALPMFAS